MKKKVEEEPLVPVIVHHIKFLCESCNATALIEENRLKETGSNCRFCNAKMVEVPEI
jgi:hypothetical protein